MTSPEYPSLSERDQALIDYALSFVCNCLDDDDWVLLSTSDRQRISSASLRDFVFDLTNEFMPETEIPSLWDAAAAIPYPSST